jgi:hypothetical protein
VGTHLRRTLARVSVVSVCSLGVIPLSSGAAHASPPSPRTFDADLLESGLSHTATLADLCSHFDTTNIPDAAHQAAFAAAENLNVRFDPAPLPPLELLSSLPLVGTLVGPPLLSGLGGLLPEIVSQVTGLDVQIPSGGDQMVFSFEGDDVIVGGSGNDYICSGEGGDVILADGGDNEIIGGSGEDVIIAGSGNDNADIDPADLLLFLGGGTNVPA